MNRRSPVIYGVLCAVWCLMMGWLAAEHYRVVKSARTALSDRAKDISSTVGVVVSSQRHFGNVIAKERLESALTALMKMGELTAVALLNAAGEIVASAGAPLDTVLSGASWEGRTVTLTNLVDLGANVAREAEGTNPPIVVSFARSSDTNRPPGPPPNFRPPNPREGSSRDGEPPPGPPPNEPPPDSANATTASPTNDLTNTLSQAGATNFLGSTNRARGRGPGGRPRFSRPFWMSETEYKAMIQKQGVHSFVIVLSTQSVRNISREDLWMRLIIGFLGSVSVIGLGLAWRNMAKSSDLQIRLVRASELTTHLKQMNVAAAGLAHETRNPLNIIRGLAQMISKQEDASPEIRLKTRDILNETDRVTAQLNEFINYSRPREVRRAPVSIGTVAGDVARALSADLEEKGVQLRVNDAQLVIDADEPLLRQALFNLLLNAVQAVDPGGAIQVVARKNNGTGAFLEVRDNGPGVPPERRTEVFKPYFTTHEKGTGLGLAVVQQIVLAHGWEIACLPNEPRGAIFRITHLRPAL